MLPFRRTFEGEKQQLQQLNSRLFQYLSRTKQLEQENAHLIAEINRLRHAEAAERVPRFKDEVRELRRTVGQLSMEKSRVEMEKEKLRRELQMVQSLRSEQTEVCRDISGELQGCEHELLHAHKANGELQQRLFQLEAEYERLEDEHRQEIDHVRLQVESRAVPIITQTYCGPPAASMEEVQEYARSLSEGWMDTFEMYQQKVEEMERSIKADQAMLSDLQREKMLYAAELDKLRAQAEKQGRFHEHLEEQLMGMQDRFRADSSEYQMIIEHLELERNAMADTIVEKMREHQQLLQVKMDLGMEVAAYRALLEGEQDAQRRAAPHPRERIIDIRMPAQPYAPRASTFTARQQDIRYTLPTSNTRRSAVPPSGSRSPSRVIPISVAGRAQHQSPASRRDMISFTKARAAKDVRMSPNVNTEKTVKVKEVSERENRISPIKASTETKPVRVVSPPMMSLSRRTETEGKKQVSDEKEKGGIHGGEFKEEDRTEESKAEKKILDSVSVEEIIEKVIKPAGLEAKVCSSGESKIRYHVEKSEQEDGTTKTQIVLESKVEEELDISADSALEELLSQGVKKVSLEDIEDTTTGSMIRNLLSGLQGHEHLENKSINVEIIEEPVESFSDEELDEQRESSSRFYEPSSAYFQIEELENVPHEAQIQKSDAGAEDHRKAGSEAEEVSRESEPSFFYQDQEQREYFVSTPDENLSDPEEGGGITSYGHYGILDDLSDERYYQDEAPPPRRVVVEESEEYKFRAGDRSFVQEGFPECIIEEEVRVSPVVQESVLEFLREDSLEPKEQLKGALEKLQSSVSGPLREELAFLTKMSSEAPQNVAVDVKKVQQSSDNGTMTIVAELNVSQSLEDSGLLEAGDDLSEEQIMAALRASHLDEAFQGGAGGFSFTVSTEEDAAGGTSQFETTERHFRLGPSEKSFTFQMETQGGEAEAASDVTKKIPQEKRIVYLESPTDD